MRWCLCFHHWERKLCKPDRPLAVEHSISLNDRSCPDDDDCRSSVAGGSQVDLELSVTTVNSGSRGDLASGLPSLALWPPTSCPSTQAARTILPNQVTWAPAVRVMIQSA